ncbi:MAG: molybdenum cofactor biosynthesis protein [Candidatus Eisenbacteria bacterium]|nr:molybdenum cofactor biosynthesis protein [Candidatus Eisenbacteria bacterium]
MRVAVLTVSDSAARGERSDRSGRFVQEIMQEQGWEVVLTGIVPDERAMVRDTLAQWCDGGQVDVIFTTGGAGFHPRDVTPEATRDVLERLTPGIDELMRRAGIATATQAALSRSTSGIRGATLIVNLPSGPQAIRQNLDPLLGLLVHAVRVCRGEVSA